MFSRRKEMVSAKVKMSRASQKNRMRTISQVRGVRSPKTSEEQIAIVRCATVKGISVRNRINKRREFARKEIINHD